MSRLTLDWGGRCFSLYWALFTLPLITVSMEIPMLVNFMQYNPDCLLNGTESDEYYHQWLASFVYWVSSGKDWENLRYFIETERQMIVYFLAITWVNETVETLLYRQWRTRLRWPLLAKLTGQSFQNAKVTHVLGHHSELMICTSWSLGLPVSFAFFIYIVTYYWSKEPTVQSRGGTQWSTMQLQQLSMA